VYGSSPDEHPALQTLRLRVIAASSTRRGSARSRRTAHASGSRKKRVTLTRMVLINSAFSVGLRSR